MGRRRSAACTYPDAATLDYRAGGSAPLFVFSLIVDLCSEVFASAVAGLFSTLPV